MVCLKSVCTLKRRRRSRGGREEGEEEGKEEREREEEGVEGERGTGIQGYSSMVLQLSMVSQTQPVR